MNLLAQDCSPFCPQPKGAEVDWLRRLATQIDAGEFVVSISDLRDEDEPIIYCDWRGTWWAGRYVGSISFEGSRLTIQPRLGFNALKNWLFEATSVALVESPGTLRDDESFIVQLLASVWAQGFIQAARHGLPKLRQDVRTTSPSVRGRIDIKSSLLSIATKENNLVSIRSERSLDHAVSDVIVAAYNVLQKSLGIPRETWLPPRLQELLPNLIAVTGTRPKPPSKIDLERVRYTPITIGFKQIAELSRQIANRRGLTSQLEADGKTKGVLLDIAELWELYVVGLLRQAATAFNVKHGTREVDNTKKLLRSDIDDSGMGMLIPDVILSINRDARVIVDAKYKRLHPTQSFPNGVQREDLYQIAAYLGRFGSDKYQQRWGILAYPCDPSHPETPRAEDLSPWTLDANKKVLFITLPHIPFEAIEKIKKLLLTFQHCDNHAVNFVYKQHG